MESNIVKVGNVGSNVKKRVVLIGEVHDESFSISLGEYLARKLKASLLIEGGMPSFGNQWRSVASLSGTKRRMPPGILNCDMSKVLDLQEGSSQLKNECLEKAVNSAIIKAKSDMPTESDVMMIAKYALDFILSGNQSVNPNEKQDMMFALESMHLCSENLATSLENVIRNAQGALSQITSTARSGLMASNIIKAENKNVVAICGLGHMQELSEKIQDLGCRVFSISLPHAESQADYQSLVTIADSIVPIDTEKDLSVDICSHAVKEMTKNAERKINSKLFKSQNQACCEMF